MLNWENAINEASIHIFSNPDSLYYENNYATHLMTA